MNATANVILGIDPGTVIMGYALITVEGSKPSMIKMDAVKLAHQKNIYQRLEIIFNTVSQLIQKHQPNTFAIEAPFFGKNVQSMLKLGRAQGVAIAAAMNASIPVCEYSPKKIKQSITGNGNATKEQVFKMLQQMVLIEETPKYFDATDALAVAICHHYAASSKAQVKQTAVKSWKDFISQNPHRLK